MKVKGEKQNKLRTPETRTQETLGERLNRRRLEENRREDNANIRSHDERKGNVWSAEHQKSAEEIFVTGVRKTSMVSPCFFDGVPMFFRDHHNRFKDIPIQFSP